MDKIEGPLMMRANLEAFEKVSSYCNNIHIDLFLQRIANSISGLGLQNGIKRYDEKAKNSKFLKKAYYNINKKIAERFYAKDLKRVNTYLSLPGLAQETTLAFLDNIQEGGKWKLPKEISDKIENIPRTPFTESRIEYLMKTDPLFKMFMEL